MTALIETLAIFIVDDLIYVYLAIAAASAAYSYDQSRKSAKAQEQSQIATEQTAIAQAEKARAVVLAEESAERFRVAWDTLQYLTSEVYRRLHNLGGTASVRREIETSGSAPSLWV